MAALCLPLLAATAAWAAGPSGGQVTGGSGQITQSGNNTTIRQNSERASLSWQSFNIGPQDTVDFIQPNASAIAINRMLGNSPSDIFGHLEANGQVWLINPNGVLFGKSAQVNVGGLVASTLDCPGSDADPRAFRASGNRAGQPGHDPAAVAAMWRCSAIRFPTRALISAQLGTVALAAGTALTLTFGGNQLLHLQMDQSTLEQLWWRIVN